MYAVLTSNYGQVGSVHQVVVEWLSGNLTCPSDNKSCEVWHTKYTSGVHSWQTHLPPRDTKIYAMHGLWQYDWIYITRTWGSGIKCLFPSAPCTFIVTWLFSFCRNIRMKHYKSCSTRPQFTKCCLQFGIRPCSSTWVLFRLIASFPAQEHLSAMRLSQLMHETKHVVVFCHTPAADWSALLARYSMGVWRIDRVTVYYYQCFYTLFVLMLCGILLV